MARQKKSSTKPKPTKKAPKAAAKKTAVARSQSKSAPSRQPKRDTGFYFAGAEFDPVVTNGKGRAGEAALAFESFEAARDGAIDRLIEIIDRCELRLWQLKRATSFDDYQQLSST